MSDNHPAFPAAEHEPGWRGAPHRRAFDLSPHDVFGPLTKVVPVDALSDIKATGAGDFAKHVRRNGDRLFGLLRDHPETFIESLPAREWISGEHPARAAMPLVAMDGDGADRFLDAMETEGITPNETEDEETGDTMHIDPVTPSENWMAVCRAELAQLRADLRIPA